MGAEVWAFENMKEVLERPGAELIGCVLPDPLRVSRTFKDGESFSWEGIDFQVYFSPGHCDYHMSMFTIMDGKRIAFSGDNVFPPGFVPSLIYRNHVHRTSHQRTALLYKDYRPQVLCSGHGLFTNIPPEGYELFLSNAEKLTALFDTLLPDGSGILGIEPSWIQIFPYQMAGEPGGKISGEIRVQNPLPKESSIAWCWAVPEGWAATPSEGSVRVKAGQRATVTFTLAIAGSYSFAHPKQAIAIDVSVDGKALGQIAEAVVENRRYGAAGARKEP
jgi:hypothetical protein